MPPRPTFRWSLVSVCNSGCSAARRLTCVSATAPARVSCRLVWGHHAELALGDLAHKLIPWGVGAALVPPGTTSEAVGVENRQFRVLRREMSMHVDRAARVIAGVWGYPDRTWVLRVPSRHHRSPLR